MHLAFCRSAGLLTLALLAATVSSEPLTQGDVAADKKALHDLVIRLHHNISQGKAADNLKLFLREDVPYRGRPRGEGPEKAFHKTAAQVVKEWQGAGAFEVKTDSLEVEVLDATRAVARVKYRTPFNQGQGSYFLTRHEGAWRIAAVEFEFEPLGSNPAPARSAAPDSKAPLSPAPNPRQDARSDFRLTLRLADQAALEINDVRSALKQLEQLTTARTKPQAFEATVRFFGATRTFKEPRAARQGLEAMLLSTCQEVCRQRRFALMTSAHEGPRGLEARPPRTEDLLAFVSEATGLFASYPPAAIRRIGLKRILVCDDGKYQGQVIPSGGGANHESVFLVIRDIPPQIVFRLHHEIFHVFDYNLLGPRATVDPEWAALNPRDFRYRGMDGFFGPDGKARMETFAAPPPPGFVAIYCTTAVHEDKAETYYTMLERGDWLEEALQKDRHIRAKVDLLESRLRVLGPEFKPGFWKKSVATFVGHTTPKR